MKHSSKRVFSLIMAAAFMIGGAGCAKKTEEVKQTPPAAAENKESAKSNIGTDTKNPIVTIEMEDGKKIKIELYPKVAPNTVANFVSLVKKGFYDGLIFHRVIPGFMIQGGDPKGIGSGGPGYNIKGEFNENGFKNDLKHTRGVISMARTDAPDTAGSQFFIMVKDTPQLDGKYAAFGKIVDNDQESYTEIDKIASVKRNANDKPLTEQKMKKVTVDTFGVDYGEPKPAK